MSTQVHGEREPLVRIAKRAGITTKKAWMVRGIALGSALIVCALLIYMLTKLNPLKVYSSMFEGALGTKRRTWVTLRDTMMLLCISIGLAPAFKMRFWNIGAEGQVLIGCLATTACLFYLGGKVPDGVLILLMLVTAMLAGAIWGLIPALFKAKWNTNETLFTLMMNYIALQLVTYFLKVFGNAQGNLEPMPKYALPKIFGGQYFLNIVIIALVCAVMYVYLKYSKHGYEISVVGESENTARYIGINVPKVIIRTMLISGALCGFIGMLLVTNGSCSVTTTITGGQGFTAILVSWLGKFNPLYMILTAFLVIFLQQGTSYMGDIYRLDTSMADIFIGVVLLFIIGCEFFINYKVNFRKKENAESKRKEKTE